MKTKLKALGFKFGHLQVIVGAVLVIAAIFYFEAFVKKGEVIRQTATNLSEDQSRRAGYAKEVAEFSEKLNDGSLATIRDKNGNVLGSTSQEGVENYEFQPRGAPKK
jgi:hypothetical protein